MGKTTDREPAQCALDELERQVIAMGNMVESLFTDSVMRLIDHVAGETGELRRSDCRAHERSLEIDNLCLDLLSEGSLDPSELRRVWASGRIVAALKRAADESLRIATSAHNGKLCELSREAQLEGIPGMAELTEQMLSDCLQAFVDHDSGAAQTLHAVYPRLASLRDRAIAEIKEHMLAEQLPMDAGVELICIAYQLVRIAEDVLEVANQMSHQYLT